MRQQQQSGGTFPVVEARYFI